MSLQSNNRPTDLQLRTQNICVFSSCDQQQQQHTKAPRTSFNGDYYSPSHSEATTMMVRIHREEQFISEGDQRTPQKFLSLLLFSPPSLSSHLFQVILVIRSESFRIRKASRADVVDKQLNAARQRERDRERLPVSIV